MTQSENDETKADCSSGCPVVASEIAEHKQAEEALRFKDSIIRSSASAIATSDLEGKMTFGNPCFQKLWGFDASAEFLGRPFWELWVLGDQAGPVMETLRVEGTWSGELKAVRKDGTLFDVHASAALVCDSQSHPIALTSTSIDITERKRMEEKLKEKTDEITRFFYTVSHDLRSPLVTIQAFLSHAERSIESHNVAALAENLGYVRNSAEKMGRLLDELLELSRIGGKVNPSEEVSLQIVARLAAALVAGRIAQRGVEVVIASQPVTLYGDVQRLVELFQNLIDNGCKFMGGQSAPRIEIGARREDEGVTLFVRDNGSGIDPADQGRIFDLFETLQPEAEGTGMGLAIVKRIVEVHGGAIRVESAGPGQGAGFYFTLANTRWGG